MPPLRPCKGRLISFHDDDDDDDDDDDTDTIETFCSMTFSCLQYIISYGFLHSMAC